MILILDSDISNTFAKIAQLELLAKLFSNFDLAITPLIKEELRVPLEHGYAAPFQYKKKIRQIQGIKFPCLRLRIDYKQDSFRLFYGINKTNIYFLRIVSKKDADKISRSIKKIDFLPDFQ